MQVGPLATQGAYVSDDVAKTDMKWFSTAQSGTTTQSFAIVCFKHICISTNSGQLSCASSRIRRCDRAS